ncbi:unnamed protein product [marine sediment metagenome]|uniref:Uncharacterized protein n=1 Tax=marine sediment metagenome TaxID=412755 RepID=X1RB48_9ZZZZ
MLAGAFGPRPGTRYASVDIEINATFEAVNYVLMGQNRESSHDNRHSAVIN